MFTHQRHQHLQNIRKVLILLNSGQIIQKRLDFVVFGSFKKVKNTTVIFYVINIFLEGSAYFYEGKLVTIIVVIPALPIIISCLTKSSMYDLMLIISSWLGLGPSGPLGTEKKEEVFKNLFFLNPKTPPIYGYNLPIPVFSLGSTIQ